MMRIWVFLFWSTIASLEKCAHEYILKVVSQSRMSFCKRALLLMDQDSPLQEAIKIGSYAVCCLYAVPELGLQRIAHAGEVQGLRLLALTNDEMPLGR